MASTLGRPAEPSLRAARLAVTAIFFIHGSLIAGWAPHIAAIKLRLGMSDALLGWVLLCMAGGALLAMQAIGWLIDRFGSRPPLLVSAVAYCALVNVPVNAPSPLLLALGLVAFGAAAGALDVAMNAQGAIVEARRGRPSMSAMHGFFSLGALAGAGLAAAMLRLGMAPWQHALGLSLAGLAGALVAVRFLLPASVDRGGGRPRSRLRVSRSALVLGLLGGIAMMAEGAMVDWSAVYLRDVAQAPADRAGWAFAGFSAAMAAVRLAGDRINARLGAGLLLRLSALVAIAGCAVMALAPGLVTGIAGAILVGIGAANCVPLVCAAAARSGSGGPGAGSSLALVVGLAYCGFLIGPPLVGGLAELFSLQAAIGVVGALLLVVALTPLPDGDRS
ncbi:MAG: MFS transporter [Alphaproteobacteria bacterium]